jgi:hypothetical protein
MPDNFNFSEKERARLRAVFSASFDRLDKRLNLPAPCKSGQPAPCKSGQPAPCEHKSSLTLRGLTDSVSHPSPHSPIESGVLERHFPLRVDMYSLLRVNTRVTIFTEPASTEATDELPALKG